ncbi:rRNA maturation RNase YbeY [Candidatus Berkelbacteria bacterium RIFCSPHIGHO2_12_FULL_36_9]|uniref:rRNA maturation RNase YbeY n=1 Tax=Candidatus Berkelbacteria bacterium RIFCSPHIGHO2_12_FULL_36_9 TaxID=1797469 RepID=A0A1F5EKS2_9BACT|nr:MAG: rRNA maturation RNase YbeY [Candidatus Berkelbacteria bacterium RIFCSPHIGHO2_12_FULL_36_9]
MKKIFLNLNNQTNHKIKNSDFEEIAEKTFYNKKLSFKYLIELSIVSENRIKNYNKEFLNKDKVSDVLSFPLLKKSEIKKYDGKNPLFLGEIIICRNQPEKKFLSLFEHGLKHLLGYHHK